MPYSRETQKNRVPLPFFWRLNSERNPHPLQPLLWKMWSFEAIFLEFISQQFIQGVTSLRGWCTTHISCRQESPECVCLCSLCMCRALMESVSSQAAALLQSTTRTLTLAVPCPGAQLSQPTVAGAHLRLFWAEHPAQGSLFRLGEDAAYFPCVLWDNLSQPRLVAIVFYHPKRRLPPYSEMKSHGSQLSWSFFCLGLTLLLFSGRPCTTVPSFSCANHQ